MKSIRKTYFFIILLALIFFVLNEILTYKISLEAEKENTYNHDKQTLGNLFLAQERYLQSISNLLATDSIVIDAYLDNNPNLLINHVNPMWLRLKKDKLIHEIHFFKPPAVSFVNFSNFQSMGLDVSRVRKDIVWVTSSFKESSHILMCKTYAGYRATSPIIDKNGTILGGLSLGEKIDWLPKILKERTKHNSFLVYNLDATQSLAPKYYKEFVKDKKIIEDLILANQTIPISEDELNSIDFEQKIQNISISGENYILYVYPLTDFNRNNMGYICSVTQLATFKSHFFNETVKNIVLIILTALLLLYLNRRKSKKILRYIHKIKQMTDNLKTRNFSFLHNETKAKESMDDEILNDIQENIVDMGLSMEKQYLYLEKENANKDELLIAQLYQDELTGLSNRNALLRDLESYQHAHIAIFNIRGFKNINDAFGFKVGNFILKEIATISHQSLSDSCLNYRISNDEFVILNYNRLTKAGFVDLIQALIQKIEDKKFNYDNIELHLNLYCGLCVDSGSNKLAKVSTAIRHAKENGLSYYVYQSNDSTQKQQIENINMLNTISLALQNDNIVSYFQPIVDREQKIIKYESLVRLITDEKVLSPYYFLEISKKTTLYTKITQVVLEKTFNAFKDSDKKFSINLTSLDILNNETVKLIYDKLDRCKNAKNVIFELVESDDLYNVRDELNVFLDTIKSKGAKIAIDDFGTGYSNFSYIIELKPDSLKIDGSLIKDIANDASAYRSVKTIINFAHDLNISVVAEFISSKEIYDICYELGVDEFQGYYFSEPKSSIEKE